MIEVNTVPESPAAEAFQVLFESCPTFATVVAKQEAGHRLKFEEEFEGAVAGINTIAAVSVLAVLALDGLLRTLLTLPADKVRSH